MATGAQEHIDATTADVFIREVWSKYAIKARENQLVFLNLVDRKFEDEITFGDTVHVPSIGNLTTVSKSTTANAATLYETVTETNTDILVQTWNYSAIAIETFAKKQVNRDLLAAYAPKMTYALALAIDDVLAGLPDDFSQVSGGALAVALTYSQVLRSRQYLDDADAPHENRCIVVAPAQETGFMELDKYIHRDYDVIHGGVDNEMNKGYMGTWLGMPVYKSVNVEGSNAAGHDNAMFQKEAIACVVQLTPASHSMFDTDYLAFKVVMEQIHGSKEMRDDHGVWLKGL